VLNRIPKRGSRLLFQVLSPPLARRLMWKAAAEAVIL
jgi:hypothetical protein